MILVAALEAAPAKSPPSSSTVRIPRNCACSAQAAPVAPPPITHRSNSLPARRGLPWADKLNRRGSGVRGAVLVSLRAHRILIVTSAYHTRRALAIFRHRLPQYQWSVAAAPDESAYGTDWWRHGPGPRRGWERGRDLRNPPKRRKSASILGS